MMSYPQNSWGLSAGLALAVLAVLTIGCGAGNGHHVSGKITFKGNPVPAGMVYILPDSTKGNSGPSGYAVINNGVYNTAAEGGRGAAPGAVIIAIEGIDPNPPANAEPDVTTTVLFPRYEVKADLAKSPHVQDIEVPAEAAEGPPQQPESSTVVP